MLPSVARARNFLAASLLVASGVSAQQVVIPASQKADHVEYPRFLENTHQNRLLQPGDRVDTRVIQLYYFRDGHRVAEYINRNTQHLNQEGSDAEQTYAREGRIAAEARIDERRLKETQALEAAKKTRQIRLRLDETRARLERAFAEQDQLEIRAGALTDAMQQTGNETIATVQTEIATTQQKLEEVRDSLSKAEALKYSLPRRLAALDAARAAQKVSGGGAAEIAATDAATRAVDEAQAADPGALEKEEERLQNKLSNLRNQLTVKQTLETQLSVNATRTSRLETMIAALNTDLGALPGELSTQQTTEIEERENVLTAEAAELRAAQEQFRREVAAGLADRDTYAKGKIASVDPVTQVTISVVGESRLQLRGPIRGINKIARMIHQIDSPVGQVKIGIHTVQVNGEHGDRMDFVYEKINREVAHSRFLVNMSARLLRRAVSEVASEVALAAEQGYLPDNCPPELQVGIVTINGTSQTTQDMRDRRYLYAFFGSDFIGELEEMDSELLNTENKMLSLNSMDTISLAGALSVTSLADNIVRERIIQRYQELLAGDLPDREFEYVRALTHVTKKGHSLQNRFRRAMRMDNKNAQEIYFNANRTYTFPNTISFFTERIPGQGVMNPVQYATVKLAQTLKAQLVAEMELNTLVLERSLLEAKNGEVEDAYRKANAAAQRVLSKEADALRSMQISITEVLFPILRSAMEQLDPSSDAVTIDNLRRILKQGHSPAISRAMVETGSRNLSEDSDAFRDNVLTKVLIEMGITTANDTEAILRVLVDIESLTAVFVRLQTQLRSYLIARGEAVVANAEMKKAEEAMFSKRLLEQFIDEQEEKSVELMEALRAHSSNVDNYLKRLAIGMEDDVAAQFYEPAFQRIRRVSRTYDVTLGQIETTTVLTNNRTLAKVSPSASMEFDLPHRDILLAEAMNGAKGLANEYGNLLKDGTFLAGASMLSGQPATGIIGSNAPVQSIPGIQHNKQFGSDLQKLIPEPEIYKFETGTGFELRPVIQPDGHSIVYTFDYLYSTNVREPVRADEKHLGRIKRHFVHTDVQTSSYELREISRYTVALKASRTSRGVPLLEDVPGVGALFRPLPSQESSLQTNIILGSSVIYPTVFDLMGLRWSRYVDDLGSPALAGQKLKQSTRRNELRAHLLQRTTGSVNQKIGIPTPRHPAVNHVEPGYLILP